MESNQLNSPDFLHKRQGKDTNFQAQMQQLDANLLRIRIYLTTFP